MSFTHHVYSVFWHDDHVSLIDQNRLPHEFTFVEIRRYDDMIRAIQTMMVRGASAIGVAAAYGLYLGMRDSEACDRTEFFEELDQVADALRATRPTARYLSWALDRMVRTARQTVGAVDYLKTTLLDTAKLIHLEDLQICQAIGEQGMAALPQLPERLRVLTHGNAGALATAGYGTALGIVRSLWTAERLERLYVCETRPRWQGAKLTAWECVQEEIPVTVIADNLAATCMRQGKIDVVIVGGDRLAANGDTAFKAGTYSLALVAKAHDIPFLVAAPYRAIDFSKQDGSQIPIEERDTCEVCQVGDVTLTPEGVDFYNPSFDITPAHLITGVVTEHGMTTPDKLHQLHTSQVVG
ncbi:MAG: S-methyl-5-thioribose-1-phosphate isomerase [Synechococcales bacterium]|nr:S-methyl-5-thioribose-1-phosphate isomerase [Synechococcales bacterium]